MEPLDPRTRSLLDEVRAGDVASPEFEAHVWRTLAPKLGQPLPPSAAAASRALSAKPAFHLLATPGLKLLVGALAIGGAIGAGLSLRGQPPAAPPSPPLAASAPSAPAPQPAEAPQPIAAESTLLAETELLAEAQRALRGGDPSQALTWIERHRARFPRGALVQEREAARVLTLCALERTGEARRVRQQFLRSWPDSPLIERVRAACPKP